MKATICEAVRQVKIKGANGATVSSASSLMRPSQSLNARNERPVDEYIQNGRRCAFCVNPACKPQAADPPCRSRAFQAIGVDFGSRQDDGGADLGAKVGQSRFDDLGVVDKIAAER